VNQQKKIRINKNKFIIKITKEGKEENKIEILLDGKEIKLCTKTLYLHFFILSRNSKL
jgi:hypothetical protein